MLRHRWIDMIKAAGRGSLVPGRWLAVAGRRPLEYAEEVAVFVLHTTPADLLRCRFVRSPLWELNNAIRTMHRPAGQRWHLPWLAGLSDTAVPPGLATLQAMQPPSGYTPDFVSPTPTSPTMTVSEEIERVARTPLDRLALELSMTRSDQPDPAARSVLDALIADPAAARDRICAALRACWEVLLAPHWPRVQSLLDADIAYHARVLADRGLIGLVDELHPDVRWDGDDVQVRWGVRAIEGTRSLDGLGLVLMPTAFSWPHPIAVLDPPWQPTVIYPARGVGDLWQRRESEPAALVAILGLTRARLLADLGEPASTTVLAERYGMAPSTVSRHLGLLLDAGLVGTRRDRRQVLYVRTGLGTALYEGDAGRSG